METPLTKYQKYYQANKSEIAERNKEKVKCECGKYITRNNIAKHKKTTTHLLKAKIIKFEFIPDEADEADVADETE
jgi:hypothetical protein